MLGLGLMAVLGCVQPGRAAGAHSITVQRVLTMPSTPWTYQNLQGFELDAGIQFYITRHDLKMSGDMPVLYIEFNQVDADRLVEYVTPHLDETFCWKFNGATIEVCPIAEIGSFPYAIFTLADEFVDIESARTSLFDQ